MAKIHMEYSTIKIHTQRKLHHIYREEKQHGQNTHGKQNGLYPRTHNVLKPLDNVSSKLHNHLCRTESGAGLNLLNPADILTDVVCNTSRHPEAWLLRNCS